MSSASAEPERVPPATRPGEVQIFHPATPDQLAVIKATSLVVWIKRGWEKVTPDLEPVKTRTPTDTKAQDAAKPSSTKTKEH